MLEALKRAWSWFRAHWYIPLFIVGAILGALVSSEVRRRGSIRERTALEAEAARAKLEAAKLAAELGAIKASQKIEEDHRETVAKLDAEQKKQEEALRVDPPKLAAFLVRAGAASRRQG